VSVSATARLNVPDATDSMLRGPGACITYTSLLKDRRMRRPERCEFRADSLPCRVVVSITLGIADGGIPPGPHQTSTPRPPLTVSAVHSLGTIGIERHRTRADFVRGSSGLKRSQFELDKTHATRSNSMAV